MMDVKHAYNVWADQYDSNDNKTRDLEEKALREILSRNHFKNCLEIGCGTGKNTGFLVTVCDHVTAIDLSDAMLEKAKSKLAGSNVEFHQADILADWKFADGKYDLVTFSLVLEHIEDLHIVFKKVKEVITDNGIVYIGELHPFKQYTGTKARFDTEEGRHVVTCFNHNISDFILSAKANGFALSELNEYFDNDDRSDIPRILTLVIRKNL